MLEVALLLFGRKVVHPTQLPMPCCSGVTLAQVHSEALKTDGLVCDRHTVLWSPAVLKDLLLFTLIGSVTRQQVEVEDGDATLGGLFLPRTSFGKLLLIWLGKGYYINKPETISVC